VHLVGFNIRNSSFNLGATEWWVVNGISWLFYVQERYMVPIVQEAGWAPQTVWTSKENLSPKMI
jgi:hypothetical protein